MSNPTPTADPLGDLLRRMAAVLLTPTSWKPGVTQNLLVARDSRWGRPCSLMGCSRPASAHHHHYFLGHLSTAPCGCGEGGEPGYVGER